MKLTFFILFLTFSALSPVRAELLPDIDAHQFSATPVQKSHSGRVYLFKTLNRDLPKTGNIIVIKLNEKPMMAFRVLKTDPIASQFIAKRVRRYDQLGELTSNQEYTMIEKVSDIVPPPDTLANQPPPPPADLAATSTPPSPPPPPPEEVDQELDDAPKKEMDVNDYDDELDGSTSPVNQKKSLDNEFDDEEAANAKTAFEIDEAHRLSPLKNMLTIQIGSYKNMANFSLENTENSGGLGVFYSHAFAQDVFVLSKAPQDSLSIEFGLIYYRRINFDEANDEYTLVPLVADLRYDLHVSPMFSFFGYAGFQYDWIMSATNASDVTVAKLQGPQPNLGVGMLYNMGPQWYLRADLGWDRLAVGVCVKW